MPRKYTRTLDDHLSWEKPIKELEEKLSDARGAICPKYQNNHKVCTLLWRMNTLMIELKSQLDGDYHSIINEEEFTEHGHIYYGGLNKRE